MDYKYGCRTASELLLWAHYLGGSSPPRGAVPLLLLYPATTSWPSKFLLGKAKSLPRLRPSFGHHTLDWAIEWDPVSINQAINQWIKWKFLYFVSQSCDTLIPEEIWYWWKSTRVSFSTVLRQKQQQERLFTHLNSRPDTGTQIKRFWYNNIYQIANCAVRSYLNSHKRTRIFPKWYGQLWAAS